MTFPEIVLASKSPRRQELLSVLGLPFTILVPHGEEKIEPGEDPSQAVMRIAQAKAQAITGHTTGIIIAADTVVWCQGKILGQPKNFDDAYQQLSMLSGKEHQVFTGLCVLAPGGAADVQYENSTVYFRTLSKAEIIAYIETKEPLDKAGSYGIQGKGALFVNRIEGCYYNIVGLPLTRLYFMLKRQGVDLLLGG